MDRGIEATRGGRRGRAALAREADEAAPLLAPRAVYSGRRRHFAAEAMGSGADAFCSGAGDGGRQGFFFWHQGHSRQPRELPGPGRPRKVARAEPAAVPLPPPPTGRTKTAPRGSSIPSGRRYAEDKSSPILPGGRRGLGPRRGMEAVFCLGCEANPLPAHLIFPSTLI